GTIESSMPACNCREDVLESLSVCSSLASGVQLQRFAAHDSAGWPRAANEVGDSGEKNGDSWAKTRAVFGQSSRILAVRSRNSPAVTPKSALGNPPKKSASMFAADLAPQRP